MISDEIAFALTTHAAKINEFTLKTVAKHISSSHGKPGNSMIQIPLTYVFGHEVSHKMFLENFNGFHVEGWKKVTVGNFIYFLQDNPEHSASKDEDDKMIISFTSEVSDGSLASGMFRCFQL